MAGWTHIRVREETAEWLRRETEHLAELVARGLVQVDHVTDRYGQQPGSGISADQVIRRLIRQAVRHRNRSRRRRGHVNKAAHNAVAWCDVSRNDAREGSDRGQLAPDRPGPARPTAPGLV